MFEELDRILSTIRGDLPKGGTFQPSEVNLSDGFVTREEDGDKDQNSVNIDEREGQGKTLLIPRYPLQSQVVAIDSTSLTLGYTPDGIVGAVRVSIVTKPAGQTGHNLEHYGPYLVPITNQDKDENYRISYRNVFDKEIEAHAPDCVSMLDFCRQLLERYFQLEIAKNKRESIILLDGSLTGWTAETPLSFWRRIIDYASENHNSIVAISKSTGLILQHSKRSILSLLEKTDGPCCTQNIKSCICQNRDKYPGGIYVAKFTPRGEPFRVDIPDDSPTPHIDALEQVAGLAGDYGYPEELKLAHMTCVLSSLEVIELQAAAMKMYGISMEEKLRERIFPL